MAQNADWREKTDPRLWQWAQQPDSAVEFLIILKNQADVTSARQLRTKAEKGQFVYETLSRFAEKDQRDLRDLLQNESALHHSFWIINAIRAKGTSILLEKVAKMPEEGRLALNPIWGTLVCRRKIRPPCPVPTAMPCPRVLPKSTTTTCGTKALPAMGL